MHNNINYYRKKKGMTVAELAEAVGTTREYLSALISGRRQLTQKWMVRLAEVFGVRPSDIINEDIPGLKEEKGTLLKGGSPALNRDVDVILDAEELVEEVLNHYMVMDISEEQMVEFHRQVASAIHKRGKMISIHSAKLILETLLERKL